MTAAEATIRQKIQELNDRLGEDISEQRWREIVHEINVLILQLKKILPSTPSH
jgi:hypothetical protein